MRFLVAVLLLATAVSSATAQGRDRSDPFPVVVDVANPPARILAEPGLEGAAERIARSWVRAARPIADELRLQPEPVAVYLMHDRSFTRWARGLLPEWGVGYANWPDGPIALNVGAITAGRKPLDVVLRHEISHVYLGQKLQGLRPPTWFVEGVAQHQAAEWGFGDTLALVQVASAGALPRLSELVTRFPAGGARAELAYRISLQALGEIDERLADRGGWVTLVEETVRRQSFREAFESLLGIRIAEFETELSSSLRGRYGWIAAIAGASTLFFGMSLLFLVGLVRTKFRNRRRLREMDREEQAYWDRLAPEPPPGNAPGPSESR